jgi:hypothetical protein
LELAEIEPAGLPEEVVNQIGAFCRDTKVRVEKQVVQLKLAQLNNKYQAKYGTEFGYEFTEGDLNRVQELINELRESIAASDLFEDAHKQRLLARLEKMQAELHKKVSDLDRFWGLMGDATVMLRKFGDDAKPIVDRVRELSQIVWNTQSHAEELPSDSPMPLIGGEE